MVITITLLLSTAYLSVFCGLFTSRLAISFTKCGFVLNETFGAQVCRTNYPTVLCTTRRGHVEVVKCERFAHRAGRTGQTQIRHRRKFSRLSKSITCRGHWDPKLFDFLITTFFMTLRHRLILFCSLCFIITWKHLNVFFGLAIYIVLIDNNR